MQAVLTQINSVPGVIGSMICDEDGQLAAQVFPQLFDASMMEDAAETLAECLGALQNATGAVDLLDLRYNEARLVVKSMAQAHLLLLCTKAVNMQLLAISLNVATKKLEKLHAAAKAQAAAAPPQPATAAVAPVAAPLAAATTVADGKALAGVPLVVQATKSTANTYWDNMVETVSLNRGTSIRISDHFKTGSFKKLKLTNPLTGSSRKFPVYIIKDDAERLFEGKAVVSLASMERLGLKEGDTVVAEVTIGGGYLGWEGI
jgi:predicted regulator of Ras-like GTPase activity (Roadblock/LC7/MglB family)